MTYYQVNSSVIRGALLMNAAFSSVCAIFLLTVTESIALSFFKGNTIWFEIDAKKVLVGLGIGLVLFAFLLLFRANQKFISQKDVKAIIIGDILWVLVSIVALLNAENILTATGHRYVAIVAIFVFLFALLQIAGLNRLYQGKSQILINKSDNRLKLFAKRKVNAPSAIVWKLLTAHEDYADVADNLAKVEVLDGNGLGMSRRCTDLKGKSWTEIANLWEEGKRYGFQVNTQANDYPYPLQHLFAVWGVNALQDNQSEIYMEFNLAHKPGLKGGMFLLLMSSLFPKVVGNLFERWSEKMEKAGAGKR